MAFAFFPNAGLPIKMFYRQKLALTAVLSSLAISTHAIASDIMISDLTIRTTTSQAGATAAYATIHNNGSEDDRLVDITVSFSKKAEIHEMKLDGDVMKMREIEGGLILPAGKMVRLEKGGNHLMFMGLTEQIKLSESYEITFEFEKADAITLTADTISLSGKTHKHKHSHNH